MDLNSIALRTVVRGGRLVTTDGDIRADIVIDDHQIVALLADSTGVDGDANIDARDLLVLPGMVDTWYPAPWLHDVDAGQIAHRAQTAALAGGLTSIAAEPGRAPGDVGTPSHLSLDAAVWLPVNAESIPSAQQIARMTQVGIIGVSATLLGERGLTDAELYQLLQVLAQHQLPLAIQPLHHDISPRDPVAELLAVTTILVLAQHTGAWVHLHGVTSAAAVRAVIRCRDRGATVTMSVPALHLGVAAESGRPLRLRPPLRPQRELDELWEYVLAEQIDCIRISPFRDESGVPRTDAQTALSLFWHEAVNRRGMSMQQAVRMLSTNPAQILGIFPKKGALRIGSDADLLLFDPAATWVAANDDALDGSGLCPIHGMELQGQITRVITHGRTVYDADHHEDDSLVLPGTGSLLQRR